MTTARAASRGGRPASTNSPILNAGRKDEGAAELDVALSLDSMIRDFRSRYRTIGESVLEIFRRAIVQGIFQPGQRLRQDDLARRIGVSRIPVRTALLQLEREGLVVFEPHRGATVRSISVDRIKEVYQLRIVLETYVLRLAIRSLSEEEKTDAVQGATRLDHSHGSEEFLDERVTFYRKLYDAKRNRVAVELIEQLRTSIGRHWLSLRFERQDFSHESLARAVQRGDEETAIPLLRDHLATVCEGIVADIETE